LFDFLTICKISVAQATPLLHPTRSHLSIVNYQLSIERLSVA